MVKKRKNTKIKYIRIKEKQAVDISPRIKSEIKELEEKREKATSGKKGLKKFFAGAAITREINEKRGFLNQKSRIELTKEKISLARQQAELEKAKTELSKLRSERVNFGRIKYDDLF